MQVAKELVKEEMLGAASKSTQLKADADLTLLACALILYCVALLVPLSFLLGLLLASSSRGRVESKLMCAAALCYCGAEQHLQ